MEEFLLEPTKTTPYVSISKSQGQIAIKGKSHSEDSLSFFRPIISEIEKYASDKDRVEVTFFLEYFNTSTAKCLFDLMRAFKKLEKRGYEVIIHWVYEGEDYDMREIGEDYEEILGLSFMFVEVSEEELIREMESLQLSL